MYNLYCEECGKSEYLVYTIRNPKVDGSGGRMLCNDCDGRTAAKDKEDEKKRKEDGPYSYLNDPDFYRCDYRQGNGELCTSEQNRMCKKCDLSICDDHTFGDEYCHEYDRGDYGPYCPNCIKEVESRYPDYIKLKIDISKTCSGITREGKRCGSKHVDTRNSRCQICTYEFCQHHTMYMELCATEALEIHHSHCGTYCPPCFKKFMDGVYKFKTDEILKMKPLEPMDGMCRVDGKDDEDA